MNSKGLLEDIFSEFPESKAVFEDFLDDVSDDEIGDDITTSEKEDDTSVEDYPHFIEWEMVAVSRKKQFDMLPGGMRMFKKRVLPMMKMAEPVLDAWKAVFYARGLDVPQEGVWPFKDAYEYFKYVQGKNVSNHGYIRIYFRMRDEEPSVRDCLKVLMTALLMTKQFRKMNVMLNLSHPTFLLDGNERYKYEMTDDMKSLTDKTFKDNKSERRIRAWVKALNPRPKALKILSNIISPIDDYMKTGLAAQHTRAKFLSGEQKCLISPYKNKTLLVIVPFGKEATVRSGNPQFDTECVFRIDGKLNMRHNLDDRDQYRNNSNWDVTQLDPEYEHVTLECQCGYSQLITDRTHYTTIDVAGRSIRELIISAEELYCADEDDLRRVICLVNTQNVGDIKYIIRENFDDED